MSFWDHYKVVKTKMNRRGSKQLKGTIPRNFSWNPMSYTIEDVGLCNVPKNSPRNQNRKFMGLIASTLPWGGGCGWLETVLGTH